MARPKDILYDSNNNSSSTWYNVWSAEKGVIDMALLDDDVLAMGIF